MISLAGSSFTKEADADRDDAAVRRQTGAPPTLEPHADRERQLVLLVDDDPHDREIYGRILCYNGFDVICAEAGTVALRLARKYMPDIVLLDIGLPDLHGLDLCSALRTDAETS